MTEAGYSKRISNGEDSYTQFKRDISNPSQLAEELVAFSNARGGLLFIGVEDDNNIVGLTSNDIHRVNQLIGNVVNSNVTPPIYPLTQVIELNHKKIIVLEIDEGINKPYSTNKGIYLTKAGSDKRKISPEELRRLFAESKTIFADEEIIPRSSISDINTEQFYRFLKQDNQIVYDDLMANKLELNTVLENLELQRNNHLTLAGNIIFGLIPQRFAPSFYIDCVYFDGNDIDVNQFISKSTIKGTLETQYKESLSFIKSNLRQIQVEKDFNTTGKMEIDERVLIELIINALIHRDYYINSSIKVFMFHNRVEIINPGKLTNSLSVDKIKCGISIHRNPIINTICKTVLPYSGYGTGIKRALKLKPDIDFINDIEKEEFRCIIPRN